MKLYILSVLFLIPMLLWGQATVPTLESEGMQGPVRRVHEKTIRLYYYDSLDTPRVIDEREFSSNREGKITDWITCHLSGNEYYTTHHYTYDESEQLTESLHSYPEYKHTVRWTYKFDDRGYLIEKRGVIAEGSDYSRWGKPGTLYLCFTWQKDSAGTIRDRFEVPWQGTTEGKTEHLIIDDRPVELYYAMDSSGVYTLRTKTVKISDDSTLFARYTPATDDTQISEDSVLFAPYIPAPDTLYTLIVQINEYETIETTIHEQDTLVEHRVTNEVDDYGNWIKRTIYRRFKGVEEAFRADFRDIDYYDNPLPEHKGYMKYLNESPILNEVVVPSPEDDSVKENRP